MGRRAAVLLASALGAAAGHAALYGALLPQRAGHAYLGWYQAVLGAAGLAALVGALLLVVLASSAATRPLAARVARALFPRGPATGSLRGRVGCLTAGSLAWLVAQESLERSLGSGHPSLALLGPGALLVAGTAAAGICLAIALVERLAVRAARRSLGAPPRPARSVPVRLRRPPVPRLVRRSPLATRAGRRAPPLPV